MILDNELIVDSFAGGGGASTGIELGLSRSVDIAINHDEDAIAMHKMNHPETEHFCISAKNRLVEERNHLSKELHNICTLILSVGEIMSIGVRQGGLHPEFCETFMGYDIGYTELHPVKTQEEAA